MSHRGRPATSLLNHFFQLLRIIRELGTRLPHGRHPFDDSIGHKFLAVDTADLGGAAFAVDLVDDRQR